MTRVIAWTLTAALAAGAGCTTSRAHADEPRTPAPAEAPAAPAPAERAAFEAVEAARGDAVRARADAERAVEHSRRAATEVRAAALRSELGAKNGVRVMGRQLKKEKAAFLGVSTSPVPGALREQMKLQRGFGLVVDTVEKESAAGTAGVQQYDILQKLNDQLLVNSQQLGVLVRSMKAGEQVSLTVLRAGQPVTLNATLTEKEMPVLGEGTWNIETPGFAGTVDLAPLAEIGELNFTPQPGNDVFRFFNSGEGESKSVYQDSDLTLTITEDGEAKSLVATDSAGTTVFDGAINTPAEREKLPKNVAEKLAKFETRMEKIKVEGKNIRLKVIEP